jgi:ABC-type branched-subunit amino acid transport system ATPase component
MEKTILDIQEIQKSFAMNYKGRGKVFNQEYKNVIKRLSMQIERGKVTALLGGNGAGKTSLFNLISGLLRPEEGRIFFYGKNGLVECSNSSAWEIAGSGIGRMFQGTRIFSDLSVMDHLLIQAAEKQPEFPMYSIFKPAKSRLTEQKARDKVEDVLKEYDLFRELLSHSGHAASSLSYAQQRLLSLAGLLLGPYELLLLDEPSSGLNPESFESLYKVIDQATENGKSVFLIEHNMEIIRNVADHCHYMSEGRLVFSGTPEEVLEKKEVKQSYLL